MPSFIAANVAEEDELPSLGDPFAALLSQESPLQSPQDSPGTAESRTIPVAKRKYKQHLKGMAACWGMFGLHPDGSGRALCLAPSKKDPNVLCHFSPATPGSCSSGLNTHGATRGQLWDVIKAGKFVIPGSRNAEIYAGMRELASGTSPEAIKERIARTMIAKCQAGSVLDDEDYRALLLGLKEYITPPCRETMRKYILEQLPGIYQEHIKKLLDSAQGKIHFTSDGWESPNHHKLICFTVHFITVEWEKMDFVLHVAHMPESCNNVTIRREFDIMVEKWGLQDRLGAITTDNGPDVTCFKRRLAADPTVAWDRQWDVDCVEHSQQLAVKRIMVQPAVKQLLLKASEQANRIGSSSGRRKYWKRELAALGWPEFLISKWNDTRWHSAHDMISDLCPKDEALWPVWLALLAQFNDHWGVQDKSEGLTWSMEEMTRLKELKEFLQPFKDCMMDGEHEKEATVNMVIFTYNLLLDHVYSPLVPDWLKEGAEAAGETLEEYYSYTPDLLWAATCVDPRWKLWVFSKGASETVSRGTVGYHTARAKACELIRGYFKVPDIINIPEPPEPAGKVAGRKRALFTLDGNSIAAYALKSIPDVLVEEEAIQRERARRAREVEEEP